MGNLSFDFTGRTAIVTGAARGIGLALATHLRRAGATVYVADYDVEEAGVAAAAIDADALPLDVSDTAAVEAEVARVVAESGRLDIVVNNAGILRDRVVWKLTDDDWNEVMAIHLGGTFRMTRAAIPHFRKQEYGRIINVTSYSGVRGNTGQANYSAAKAGIIGFTKTVAKEVAAFGITVNALLPNAATRMIESIPEAKLAELAAVVPMGRFGRPDEMAAAVSFLASEEAGYITGITLPVDGGASM
ncbi:3-oxoacyl-ACP reductase FabG [Jiangella anatolica]|uniref:3-oxoacyl-ACP reductase n=1 Tax=Jiangella anatolica TaxID=2670374 RepID=A0A2W2B4N5_9ACTN|nr:3-oxoacyl-ACP reductase FabG [Jiangella anatolica]PZF82345.1 3-oxoacyl-ACP reductase [Jiangella anatolica]